VSGNAVAVVSAGFPLNVVSKYISPIPGINIRLRVTVRITSTKIGRIEQRVERTTYGFGFGADPIFESTEFREGHLLRDPRWITNGQVHLYGV
jgi:hypothetical protein